MNRPAISCYPRKSRVCLVSLETFEVFFACPDAAGVEAVHALNRQEALEIASADHPGCTLAAFHQAMIPASYRDSLLQDWLATLS